MAVYPTGAIHKPVDNFCWDTGTMSWIMSTCGSGGGGGGATTITDGVDPTIVATVLDLVDSNPLTVAIVDANGDQITDFSSGVNTTVTDTVNGFTDTVIDVAGAQSLTIFITTADLAATLQAQVSMTALPSPLYLAQYIYETSFNALTELKTSNSIVMTGGGAFRTFMMVLPPGAKVVRLHVSAYTSGTGALALFASSQIHNTLAALMGTDTTTSRTGVMIAAGNSSGAPRIPVVEAFSSYGRFTPGLVTHIASGDNAAAPVTVQLGDGTNSAAVKAASTAAVAADKAQVVAISPNNTVAVSNASLTSIDTVLSASGNLTGLAQTVVLTIGSVNRGTGIIQSSGTFNLNALVEASADGTNWSPLRVLTASGASGGTALNATTGDVFFCPLAGLHSIRVRCTAYTSGTMALIIRASSDDVGGWLRSFDNIGIIGGDVTAAQGDTNGDITNAWSMMLSDRVSGPVGVTPASTAPTAIQPALVVSESPNGLTKTSTSTLSAPLQTASITLGGLFSTMLLTLDTLGWTGYLEMYGADPANLDFLPLWLMPMQGAGVPFQTRLLSATTNLSYKGADFPNRTSYLVDVTGLGSITLTASNTYGYAGSVVVSMTAVKNPAQARPLPAGDNVIGRVTASALVDDVGANYLPGVVAPLSMTPDGRLRVVASSDPDVDFFAGVDMFSVNPAGLPNSPFGLENLSSIWP